MPFPHFESLDLLSHFPHIGVLLMHAGAISRRRRRSAAVVSTDPGSYFGAAVMGGRYFGKTYWH